MKPTQDQWEEPHYEQRVRVHKVLEKLPLNHYELEQAWRSYFSKMLYMHGWNKQAIACTFAWGRGGHNWKALWHTKNDKLSEAEKAELVQHLESDLSYFSDRMSLDRLFRLHHHYNGIQASYYRSLDYPGSDPFYTVLG